MRTLAVDHGDRRVGLALSDAGGSLASPLDVLTPATPTLAVAEVAAIAAREGVQQIVVGLPYDMDGGLGKQAQKVLAFARDLRAATNLPTLMADERLSSFDAETQLIERKRRGEKLTRGKKKRQLDAMAAASFLAAVLRGDVTPQDVTAFRRP
jgi:putative Holliday junction resolvase